MVAGAWSLVPPVLAIVAALVTRRVHQSLLLGTFSAGILVTAEGVEGGWSALPATIAGGFIETIAWLVESVSDRGNAAIFVFVLFLGAIIALLHRAGAMGAFAAAASRRFRSRRAVQTLLVGTGASILSIDDHFNTVAAGTMFRPLTDRSAISREKLAYLVDSTAAPVAILMPLSTWAGFMVAFTEGALEAAGHAVSGFGVFLASIPWNLYAWATLALVLTVALTGRDAGPMAKAERRAAAGAVVRPGSRPLADPAPTRDAMGDLRPLTAWDLLAPLAFLFLATAVMLWMTGRPAGGIRAAIGAADAPLALALSTALTILFCFVWFGMRAGLRHDDAMDTVLDGFKAMLPAVVILALAFTLGRAVQAAGLGGWVAGALGPGTGQAMLPLLAFLAAAVMAFATGTSFGTYAVMIPIGASLVQGTPDPAAAFAPVLGAIAGGGVFGDHCSPISDTTVLSSMASQCDHIDHVRTQLPYALLAGAGAAGTFALTAAGLSLALALVLAPSIVLGGFLLACWGTPSRGRAGPLHKRRRRMRRMRA